MAKQTKRQRKFQTSGGIKARIEKGTVVRHGKVRKKKRRRDDGEGQVSIAHETTRDRPDRSDDFLSTENLGSLDLDSFLNKLSDDPTLLVGDEEGSTEDSDLKEENKSGKDNLNEDDEEDDKSIGDSDGDEGKDEGEESGEGEESDEGEDKNSDNGESSDNDSSDDEDDLDAAEARMKSELEKMQQSDPDFHKFLQENEKSLLEFGQEESVEDDDDDDNDHYDDRENEQGEAQETGEATHTESSTDSSLIQLSPQVLANLKFSAFHNHKLKSLRDLVRAYKSACHLADSSSSDADRNKAPAGGKLYSIESSKVFDELMVVCLSRCHEGFHHHLLGPMDVSTGSNGDDNDDHEHVNLPKREQKKPDDDGRETASAARISRENEFDKPLYPHKLEKSHRWLQIKPILASFFQSTIHLLHEAKDSELLVFVLKSISKSLRFLSALPRLADSLLRTLTLMWSAPLDSSEDYQAVRLHAFFRIRQLALVQPFPFIEDVLKKTYLSYAKRCKFGTSAGMVSSTLPTLTFMGNCLVELYNLDFHSSYQHAFVYIRQLALLLRNAMQKKTEETVQQVFCWQYFHCLKLWVALLSSAATAEDGTHMRSLIYPLAEIILGVARFAPSPIRHMPCRFHCIRLLQQLAAASETFIPTTSLLLDCFDWKEWYIAPKNATAAKTRGSSAKGPRVLQLAYILKLPGETDFLRSHDHLEAGINDLFLLLQREIELYRFSPGFPEFSIRIQVRLGQFLKATRNARWRAFAKSCIELIETYKTFAIAARSKLLQAPKDIKRLECLLPIGEKTMRERHEVSIVSEQKLFDAIRPAPLQRRKAGKGQDDNDVNHEDSSMTDLDETIKMKNSGRSPKATNTGKKDSSLRMEKIENQQKQTPASGEDIMETDDHVQEGIDWSDEDSNE